MLSTSSNLDHRKWRAVCVWGGGGEGGSYFFVLWSDFQIYSWRVQPRTVTYIWNEKWKQGFAYNIFNKFPGYFTDHANFFMKPFKERQTHRYDDRPCLKWPCDIWSVEWCYFRQRFCVLCNTVRSLWVIILSLSINTPVQTYILNGPSMLAGIEQFWLVLYNQSTFYRF